MFLIRFATNIDFNIRMKNNRQLYFLLNFFVVFFHTIAIANEFSLDTIVHGTNSNRNTILSGEVTYTFEETVSATKSPEEIESIIDAEITKYLASQSQLDRGHPRVEASIESSTETLRLKIKELHEKREIKERRKYIFELRDNHGTLPTQNYRYRLEIQNIIEKEKTGPYAEYLGWNYQKLRVFDGTHQTLIHSTNFAKVGVQTSAVRMSSDEVNSYEHIELWGRSKPLIPLAEAILLNDENKDNPELYVITHKDSETPCQTPLARKLWIDPNRGLILVKEDLISSDQLIARTQYRKIQQFENGIWFPMEIEEVYLKGGIDPNSTIEPDNIGTRIKCVVQEVKFNHKIEDHVFEVDVPTNVVLMDLDYTPALLYLNGVLIGP